MARKRFVREADFETEGSEPAVMAAIAITKSNRNERGPDDWETEIGGRTDTKTGTKPL